MFGIFNAHIPSFFTLPRTRTLITDTKYDSENKKKTHRFEG